MPGPRLERRIDGGRGVTGLLRSRETNPGRPACKFRFYIWHDADVLLGENEALFGRLVDAMAGVAAEAEYVSDDLLMIHRTVFVGGPLLPSAGGPDGSLDTDRRLRALRKDATITAVLHSGYPVRHWDHDIGPAQPHLLEIPGGLERSDSGDDSVERRDLTPDPGQGLRGAGLDVSRDGRFVVTSWQVPAPGAALRSVLVRIDVATAERAVVADDPGADLFAPAISPDGTWVAFVRETISTPAQSPRITLCVMRFGERFAEVTADWDRWPADAQLGCHSILWSGAFFPLGRQ